MGKRSRALLTDHDRNVYGGEVDVDDSRRWEKNSRVRSRINDELPEDLKLLLQNEPELYFDVLEVTLRVGLEADMIDSAPDNVQGLLEEIVARD